MRRVAIAIEAEIPDALVWPADEVEVAEVSLSVGAEMWTLRPTTERARIVRWEIHPDPAALFDPDTAREEPPR